MTFNYTLLGFAKQCAKLRRVSPYKQLALKLRVWCQLVTRLVLTPSSTLAPCHKHYSEDSERGL